MRSQPYKIGLDERLKDPEYVAAYLNAAKKESQKVFLLALRDVAEAHKISKVAAAAGVNRETLYRTLSARGNPTLATLESILDVLGLEEQYCPRVKRKRAVPTGVTGSVTPTKEVASFGAGPLSNVSGLPFLEVRNAARMTVQSVGLQFNISATAPPAAQLPNCSLVGNLPDQANAGSGNAPFWNAIMNDLPSASIHCSP